MKAAVTWTFFVVAVLVLTIPLAATEKQAPKYDLGTELTLSGTVEEVKLMGADELKETHLVVKTDKGLVEVCLCPAKFLSELEASFAKGDKVVVTGSKVINEAQNSEVVLAREITKENDTLVLRDKKGGPVWTWRLKK